MTTEIKIDLHVDYVVLCPFFLFQVKKQIMTESASSTSGQEFDVFSVMDWKDGVGTLPGSDLKVSCLYYIQLYMCVYLYVFIMKMNLSTYVT